MHGTHYLHWRNGSHACTNPSGIMSYFLNASLHHIHVSTQLSKTVNSRTYTEIDTLTHWLK
jgi:hypothetical protein